MAAIVPSHVHVRHGRRGGLGGAAARLHGGDNFGAGEVEHRGGALALPASAVQEVLGERVPRVRERAVKDRPPGKEGTEIMR
eukprot:605278-Prorocentrum_minimum.AAC.2